MHVLLIARRAQTGRRRSDVIMVYIYIINLRRSRDGAFVRGGRPCGVPSSVAAVRVEFLRPWRPSVWSSFVRAAVRVEFLRPWRPSVWSSFVRAAVRVEFLRPWRPSVWSSFVRGGRPCVDIVPSSVWSLGDSFSSLCTAFTLCT